MMLIFCYYSDFEILSDCLPSPATQSGSFTLKFFGYLRFIASAIAAISWISVRQSFVAYISNTVPSGIPRGSNHNVIYLMNVPAMGCYHVSMIEWPWQCVSITNARYSLIHAMMVSEMTWLLLPKAYLQTTYRLLQLRRLNFKSR